MIAQVSESSIAPTMIAQVGGWNADITRDRHAESGVILQESLFKESLHTQPKDPRA
jgi:hypothetical protein